MLSFFQKKTKSGKEVTFKIEGMHCPSCAMNIDGALEDTVGVTCAETNYARAQTKVIFDEDQIDLSRLLKIVADEGYMAEEIPER